MKARTLAILLVAALASPAAWAQQLTLDSVAAETGLSVREVKMVLGAPVAFSEFRSGYIRARNQLVRSIGRERYEELAAAFRAGEVLASRES